MNIDQYNAARSSVQSALEKMMIARTDSAIADFYVACAINGLVAVLVDDSPYIPTPICGFIQVPVVESDVVVPHYIFPADQHLP